MRTGAKVACALVGYDRQTECPADTQLGDWELTVTQAREIGRPLKADVNIEQCDFFLEPVSTEPHADRPPRAAATATR